MVKCQGNHPGEHEFGVTHYFLLSRQKYVTISWKLSLCNTQRPLHCYSRGLQQWFLSNQYLFMF